jgi:hypothetical protein
MSFRFPIKEIKIQLTTDVKSIEKPKYSEESFCLNQNEFVLDIENTARFYAKDGNHIEIMLYPKTDTDTIELYLNGSVYGAILHQRKDLPIHGSSFQYKDKGIMICGESGAGKSSLTAAFCISGSEFLTDDITPIVFENGVPYIWVMSDKIKLWSDSLQALNQNKESLAQIMPDWEKFYLPMPSKKGTRVSLDHIFILDIHERTDICLRKVEGLDKFTVLRNEVYRKEFLRGMPESESEYLRQIVYMASTIPVTKVSRHESSSIELVKSELEKYIQELYPQESKVLG